MPWIAASLVSALFLGVYELATKHAVRDNAVLPVLFLANVCSAGICGAVMAVQTVRPDLVNPGLHVDALTPLQHAQLALKSLVVAASWVCTYFALKHLPLSIVSPIRASSPIWTLLGALLVLGERPTWLELVGIVTTLASFALLSLAGRQEGIHFHRDKWIAWVVAGVLLGTISALYDKFLLGRVGFSAATVQAWFSIYLAVLFLPLAVGWKLRWWTRHQIHWRWSVPVVSVALLLSDYIYFSALRDPEALISLVSSIRRASTVVAFVGGLWFFHERQGWEKVWALVGVMVGIVLTIVG